MAEPIVLNASDTDEEALVAAIKAANNQNAPLLLQPGNHLTKRGRGPQHRIPIGRNGLTIGALMPPPAKPPTIKRPNSSIDLAHPDDNHGLFFEPAGFTRDEHNQAQWKHYQHEDEEFEFAIILRGSIRISGISLNCNMGKQGLEGLPPNVTAEHSCMLGFAGKKFPAPANPNTGMPRFIFIGFELVELTNLQAINGGYSDEIWISRGYFNPNIAKVRVDRLVSTQRVNEKRATVDFSGLCKDIRVTNSEFFRLGCEATDVPFREMPRATPAFTPSLWTLSDLKLKGIDLGAHGRSYTIRGTRLSTSKQCNIHEAGGSITDSQLHVTDRQRLIAMDHFEFRRVDWTLSSSDGVNLGIKITADQGQPSTVSFLDNTFQVQGSATDQVIIDSEYSNGVPANQVRVTATGCTYPNTFGNPDQPPIAHVFERGRWTFAKADLGTRTADVALPKNANADVIRELI